jgi:hypothetical protein
MSRLEVNDGIERGVDSSDSHKTAYRLKECVHTAGNTRNGLPNQRQLSNASEGIDALLGTLTFSSNGDAQFAPPEMPSDKVAAAKPIQGVCDGNPEFAVVGLNDKINVVKPEWRDGTTSSYDRASGNTTKYYTGELDDGYFSRTQFSEAITTDKHGNFIAAAINYSPSQNIKLNQDNGTEIELKEIANLSVEATRLATGVAGYMLSFDPAQNIAGIGKTTYVLVDVRGNLQKQA